MASIMQYSSYTPSTPASPRNPLCYKPLNSSPLVSSPASPKSSPLVAAQARRKSQYKSYNTPSTPTRSASGSRRVSGGLLGTSSSAGYGTGPEPDSQKTFLRERFKARCYERAVKARDKAVKTKRYMDEFRNDDFQMDDDEEEDDETIMQDELFRRIMANASRKEAYSYKLSYAQEVGSSFDPDMEDVGAWEQALSASNSGPEEGITPEDLDNDELEAYAEECARRAAFADFEDIPESELFGWCDIEDSATSVAPIQQSHEPINDEDNSMDFS